MERAGLYIHIPFCLRKCAYCDFVSYAGREDAIETYISALLAEMEDAHRRFPCLAVPTVYVGGGTPSCMPPGRIARVLKRARELFAIGPDAEITVETNPETADRAKMEEFARVGVNRLSLGLQSANGRILQAIGRLHGAEDFVRAAELARRSGIVNIGADVMYGLPGQTVRDHLDALETAADAGVVHVSTYALTLAEGTPLCAAVAQGSATLPDEEAQYEMYCAGNEFLEARGFLRYEVSNYAKPGFACRHNLVYWRNRPYVGVGAAAHSCVETEDGVFRVENVSGLDEYVAQAIRGASPATARARIGREESMFETMMLGLRLTDGVDLSAFLERYGADAKAVYAEPIVRLAASEMIRMEKGRLIPTRKGLDFHNRMALEFLENELDKDGLR